MLVLGRRVHEAIILTFGGLEARVSVQTIGGGRVQLGIDAPKEVVVLREELRGTAPPQPQEPPRG
jgi:carbon storage regulator CsrA